jgi:hypothetical protein
VPYRPPYRLAAAIALVVLAGYLITLAPTVTFWDAGEFIAAARTLGIPHPPGTPLYVLVAHLWGALWPWGEYAARLNLLSAALSAVGVGCLALVVHRTIAGDGLDRPGRRWLAAGSAAAAALIAGFTFTAWQNSNETEVYAVATCTIAAMAWLVLRWRDQRESDHGPRLLLLLVYLGGLSVGNHLLALLAGPAVVAFLCLTLRQAPAASRETRRAEWAQLAVVAGVWALLVAGGLGATTLALAGAIGYLLALGLALRARIPGFALLALALALIGVSSYLFLYLRAAQHPIINEAQPDSWAALLGVIRRAEYPVRTPFDDPTVLHGSGNPGRGLLMLGLQLLNYLQYFDWQWANGVSRSLHLAGLEIPVRSLVTGLFTALGVGGAMVIRRADRAVHWLLLTLFLTTGLALMVYMNFKPGFSLAYDLYPNAGDHEVRERDYFFVVSYLVWGLWSGVGLARLTHRLLSRSRAGLTAAATGLGLMALVPFAANFSAASRRHGADATLAADFAYDLLNSMPPYGVLFTYGDNDTFPLWWAQEVAGIRRDVTVVCLALAETDWYRRQLNSRPRAFDSSNAPAIWHPVRATVPDGPTLDLSEAENSAIQSTILPRDLVIPVGPLRAQLRRGTLLSGSDFVVLRILQDNIGRRPVGWAITTGRQFYGLDRYVVQQGLISRLRTEAADSADPTLDFHRLLGLPLDVPLTERLAFETYRYGRLLDPAVEVNRLEPTSAGMAGNLSLPFTQLAYAYRQRGQSAQAAQAVERAQQLAPPVR